MIDPLWCVFVLLITIGIGILLHLLGRVIVDILREIKRNLDIGEGKK